MAKVKALTDRTIAERFAEIKDEASLWGDIGPAAQRMVSSMVGSSLEAELVARLGAERYKRTEVVLRGRGVQVTAMGVSPCPCPCRSPRCTGTPRPSRSC